MWIMRDGLLDTLSQFHARQWWGTASIPAPGRQRQADFCEFKACQVYRVPGQPRLHRETMSQKTNKKFLLETDHNNCIIIVANGPEFTDEHMNIPWCGQHFFITFRNLMTSSVKLPLRAFK